ncbi:MAG: T9SS type A sorting domain-containing protein [Bacteroidetes bacterium]|nr:T9SS type A sorting domain-containing protein [Bacteroidota bacterium]
MLIHLQLIISESTTHRNPVTESTVFAYNLTGTQNASLSIFDATGRLVNVLFNEMQSTGKHFYNWIGDDSNGNLLGGGVYYYSLVAGGQKVSGKLVIVR